VEILKVTAEVERQVGQGATADKIAEAGRAAGMQSLWESGLAHVPKGESTIDELLRVVDMPQDDEALERRRSGGAKIKPEAAAPAAPETPRRDSPPELRAPERPARFEGAAFELLVDDEDQLRRVMRGLLERDGYDVIEAADGVEALDQVDRHGPDIIVLDLSLPGLDGYGVLSHLRSRRVTQHIPVVVLTAWGDEENEVRVFEFGADDFLSKPFRARALSARLDAVLRRVKGRDH
jgi:CheY-like chemotaxis protein